MPTRTLALKSKDVEKVRVGAGHVVSEAYIPDLQKWVFMDAQLDYIPFLDNVPLNAVEFQRAILHHSSDLELRNLSGNVNQKRKKKIIKFVGRYLYFFDVRFDQSKENKPCQDKVKLILVPLDASNPVVFQRKSPIDYCLYTHNLRAFYKSPIFR